MIRELDLHGVVIPAVGPGIAKLGPVVGVFLLAALLVKALLEQAKLIPQTVAGQGQVAGSGGIQEAGCQTAQAAVAQSGIFHFLQNGQVHAPGGEELLHLVQDAQVVEVGIHQPTDEIFGGNIVGLPLLQTGPLAAVPVVGNGHHYSLAQSLVQLLRSCLPQGHVIGIFQLRFGPFEDVVAIVIHHHAPIFKGACARLCIRGAEKTSRPRPWIKEPYRSF